MQIEVEVADIFWYLWYITSKSNLGLKVDNILMYFVSDLNFHKVNDNNNYDSNYNKTTTTIADNNRQIKITRGSIPATTAKAAIHSNNSSKISHVSFTIHTSHSS